MRDRSRAVMSVSVVIACVALVFLSGCALIPGSSSGGVVPITIPQVRTGTDGVVAQYLAAQPPDSVYEGTDLVAGFSLHNQGAADIRNGRYRLVTNKPSLFVLDDSANGVFDLAGKTPSDTRGAEEFYQSRVRVADLPSLSQGESARLDLHLCYQYSTIASQEVCVDTSLGAPTLGTKPCTQAAVSASGGQGGPVALTSVDLKVLPDPDVAGRVLPVAVLKFSKPSGKTVMLPEQYDYRCTGASDAIDTHARVHVTLGEESMRCGSGLLDFSAGDTATIECSLDQGVEKTRGTYVSVIRAEVDYGYHDIALKKTVQVQERTT